MLSCWPCVFRECGTGGINLDSLLHGLKQLGTENPHEAVCVIDS